MSDIHTIIGTLKWAAQQIDAEALAAKALAHAANEMHEAKRAAQQKHEKWIAAMAEFKKAQAEAEAARRELFKTEHDVPEWRAARCGPKGHDAGGGA